MENMICYECVLKHLSASLSYGKEIMSGHGKGADLDHRIDFLGQITNAEHHLQLIDHNLFNQISAFRKQIQNKKVEIDQSDLEFIRKLYLITQMKEDGIENIVSNSYVYVAQGDVDLVYIEVKNLEHFRLSYEMVKKHLKNYNKIYVLKSQVDLSGFDVVIVDKTLKEFAQDTELSDDFVVMYENTGFLKETDAKAIVPTYSMEIKDHKKQLISLVQQLNIKTKLFLYDFIKPQLINKAEFNNIIAAYSGQYWLTAFNLLANKKYLALDNSFTVYVDRPICCSIKSNLKIKHYVRWNQEGFESLITFLNK